MNVVRLLPSECKSRFRYHKTTFTHIKRNEIWWIELDGVGSEQRGRRPALIIQNDIGNTYSPTTIIAPITTGRLNKKLPTHVTIKSEESGLQEDSVILTEQVKVIDRRRLISKIGSASKDTMKRVNDAIMISMGITEKA